jgi:hypothetical protein
MPDITCPDDMEFGDIIKHVDRLIFVPHFDFGELVALDEEFIAFAFADSARELSENGYVEKNYRSSLISGNAIPARQIVISIK